MTSSPSESGRYHHGNLHRALIDATLQLISEKGVKAFTIREVAKRAGVSHAAPYRHFKDKDALLVAVAKDGFNMMIANTRTRFEKYPDDPLARFQISGLAYIDFAIENPSHYRVMFDSGENRKHANDELVELSMTAFEFLFNSISECQEKNIVKKGDTREFALSAWSIAHGYAMLYINGFIGGQSNFFTEYTEKQKNVITESLYVGLKPETTV